MIDKTADTKSNGHRGQARKPAGRSDVYHKAGGAINARQQRKRGYTLGNKRKPLSRVVGNVAATPRRGAVTATTEWEYVGRALARKNPTVLQSNICSVNQDEIRLL